MNIFRMIQNRTLLWRITYWRLNCTEHRCLYAPFAFERVYNANSCSGNHHISADVTGTVSDTKKPSSTAGFLLILLKQLLSEAYLQRR